jgi:hypothetical protein
VTFVRLGMVALVALVALKTRHTSEYCLISSQNQDRMSDMIPQGTLTEGESSYGTVDLLVKVACFVKKYVM